MTTTLYQVIKWVYFLSCSDLPSFNSA